MCHNCDDLLLKSISSVINHVWDNHKVEVAKIQKHVLKAEDARLPRKRTGKIRVSGYRCEECNVSLSNISSLLDHLDRKHGIHIWYEKGIASKRLFLDGILDDKPTRETKKKQEWVPISKDYKPISQRPHKPGKSDATNDYELRNQIWLRDQRVCQNCGREVFETIDPQKNLKATLSTLKEIPIFKWFKECWKCQKETPIVTYDLTLGYNFHLGDIEKLDKIVMEKYPFVKRTFSKTRGTQVIANTCVHCGSLQGNWFILEDIIDMVYSQDMNELIDIVLPNNLTVEDLPFSVNELKPFKEKTSFGHIHHKDGNPKNNNPDNLILLCRNCHLRLHSGRSHISRVSYYRKERERRRVTREKKQVEKWRSNYYARKTKEEIEKPPEQQLLLEDE